jgi:hypothetical protein
MDAIYRFLPMIGAGLGAFAMYLIGDFVAKKFFTPKASTRVKDMTTSKRVKISDPSEFGSKEYRIRLAFQKFRINVSGWEDIAVNLARFLVGGILMLVIRYFLGLPTSTSLIGFIAGLLIVNTLLSSSWRNMCNDINKEIPIFLSGFTSTIQVSPNVLQAVEEEAGVLQDGSHLRWWLENRFLKLGQEKNVGALDELIDEGFRVSTSLGSMVFLIGRLWQTGGYEWQRAFNLAAENIEGVMAARILGLAAGSAAKGSVNLIIGVTLAVIFVMARRPGMNFFNRDWKCPWFRLYMLPQFS